MFPVNVKEQSNSSESWRETTRARKTYSLTPWFLLDNYTILLVLKLYETSSMGLKTVRFSHDGKLDIKPINLLVCIFVNTVQI
jgi:hypothetical protein